MMPVQPRELSEAATVLCAVGILLVPQAAAGLALLNTGFGRGRNAAHSMIAALCVFSVAVLVYLTVGFSLQSYPGGPAHQLTLAGHSWRLLGDAPLMMGGRVFSEPSLALLACMQLFCVGLAAIIPLGSGSGRWRLGACCASSALLAGIVYPLFAHWMWGGGWLAQLGGLDGCGIGALDLGGAAVIQAVGGISALCILWILGPRHGKYETAGMAIPAHNMPLVLFGCLLAFLGWIGLDTAGALLFDAAAVGSIALIAVNNAVAAGTAFLTSLLVTRIRYRKPDASLAANGFLIGLISISAASSRISPAIAAAVALVAGLAAPFSVELLDRFGFDDPSGAVSVHGLGGLWAVLAAGLFVPAAPGQWIAQVVTISALLGVVLPLTYGLNRLVNLIYPYRVSQDGERQGMDLHELGAGAYPELSSLNADSFFH
jgi:Amt family ammonium transporter